MLSFCTSRQRGLPFIAHRTNYKFSTLHGRLYSATATKSPSLFAPSLTPQEIENQSKYAAVLRYIDAYRTFGHFEADLDPLKRRSRKVSEILSPSLYGVDKLPQDAEIPLVGLLNCVDRKSVKVKELPDLLRKLYCGTTGVEFSHLETAEERLWFSREYERVSTSPALTANEKNRILNLIQRSEVFDHYMQTKFTTTKRYGLEGCEAMMPCMDAIFQRATQQGLNRAVISMPHRGRLNFLTGLLYYPASSVFSKVSGYSDAPYTAYQRGTGDVLSHIAQSVDLRYEDKFLHVSLLHNPSHLEASNPVAMGKVRARQDFEGNKNALCIMIHGDAAMSAQGVVPETLVLSQLPEYSVGGTMHVVVNNQIGFTTDPHKGRSSWHCTDVGKMIMAPAIHVNADDPEAVVRAVRLAMDYRMRFEKDVFVDLSGYRRHGHNEVDEPSFTQPAMYSVIRSRPTLPTLYSEKLIKENVVKSEDVQKLKDSLKQHLENQYAASKGPRAGVNVFHGKWIGMQESTDMTEIVETGVSEDILTEVGLASIKTHDCSLHPRLESSFCNARKDKIQKKRDIDWATAEALSFGSLLLEGSNVRLSGQDVGRGTFSHRHVRLVDQKLDHSVIPLNFIQENQKGKLIVADSPLSELAVMSFEYGYSIENPNTLVLWEAQFGDFSNGAQVAIDQFIVSGEDKWWRQTGLTLLLPHGYDGAGPEHSSCRMERYLQLCNGDRNDPNDDLNKAPNLQVVCPTTPANYFHMLRRQMKRFYRKPLVVAGPKMLLRLPEAVSSLHEMGPGTHFQSVIPDVIDPQNVTKVVFCTGKLFYELKKEREAKGITDTALVRLEELSPFPYKAVMQELERYSNARKYTWAQEEAMNMGAWSFVEPRFFSLLSAPITYVGRPAEAAPAVGLPEIHKKQREDILLKAWQ